VLLGLPVAGRSTGQGLAGSYQHGGDARRAHRHWREAVTLYTELGAPEAEQVLAELAGDAAGV
jgi:hypothetical protein